MSIQTDYEAAVKALREDNGNEPHPMAETLLAGAFVGADQRRIAKLVPYTWSETFERCRHLRDCGLFVGSRVDATGGWQNGLAFWLDVLVAEGMVERVPN